MGHYAYDYLADTQLFKDDEIHTGYAGLSDSYLRGLLDEYRHVAVAALPTAVAESRADTGALSLYAPTTMGGSIDVDLVQRSILYFDRVTFDDPLYAVGPPPSSHQQAFEAASGLPTGGIPRETIAAACQSMKRLAPCVADGFARLAPLTALDERTGPIPVEYSPTRFAERLSPDVLAWLKSRARVGTTFITEDGRALIRNDGGLEPCRGLSIDFGADSDFSHFYQLFEMEPGPIDEETREGWVKMSLPKTPPDREMFDGWRDQSLNRAAFDTVKRVERQIRCSEALNAPLVTRSQIVADLLARQADGTKEPEEELARLALTLPLTVLDGVPPERLLEIRQRNGAAFETFRNGLRRRLNALRRIADTNELQSRLRDTAFELENLELREVAAATNSLKKQLGSSAAVLASSLMAAIPTGGVTVLGAIAAGVAGYKAYADYRAKADANPAFFLWKVQTGR